MMWAKSGFLMVLVGLVLWLPVDQPVHAGDARQPHSAEIQNPHSQSPIPNSQLQHREDRQRLARQYSRGWYWFYFVNQAYGWLVFGLILWTGFSARLRRQVERVTQRRWGIVLMYGGLFIVLMTVLFLPFDLFAFWREKRYGFANQTLGAWLGDELKELAVGMTFGLPAMLIVYTVFKRAPRRWWLWGSGVLIGFVIFAVAIAPVFVAPLFNTFEPLKDPALRQRILALANQHGIPAHEVYQVDASRQSSHTNAYVVGLLGTQRIVLYDTLLQNFTPEEIEFVMAHEMGHYRLNHIWKGIGLSSVAIVIGMWLLHRIAPYLLRRYQRRFGFGELADVASLPLLMLLVSVSTFLLDPLSNGVSRYMERQADAFGLAAAPHPAAAVPVFEKFEMLDLSESDPPPFIEFWLYSHPSLKHRIEAVNKFLARPSGGL